MRPVKGMEGLSAEQVVSVLVVAFFEMHFTGEMDVWEIAIGKVEGVVDGLREKVD